MGITKIRLIWFYRFWQKNAEIMDVPTISDLNPGNNRSSIDML